MINIPVEPKITEYIHSKAAKTGTPINGTFELTPCCNMNCKMCYVRMTKKEQESVRPLRTAKEWIDLAGRAREQGMLFLLLTGGEPFLRPDFREIFQSLHHMGFVISINSNGTLIDEETVEWLKETPPIRINITVYGASDKTYERLCGNPNGFTATVRAIRLLKEAGITVKVNYSVTPYNVDDLETIIDFCKKEKLVIQPSSYMFPPLRRNVSMVGRNERFTPEEAAYQTAKIEMLLNGKKAYRKKMELHQPLIWSSDMKENYMEAEGDGIQCRAGKCSFWVTWEGKLLPCGMMVNENAGNVFEEDFAQVWKRVTEEVKKITLPVQCKNCKLKEQCRACAAMVMTESGNYKTVPKYRCEMAKAYYGACQRVLEEI